MAAEDRTSLSPAAPESGADAVAEQTRPRQLVSELRRLPALPVVLLLLVLVIPAIFANQIAPHDPTRGSLGNRLAPPVWQEGGTSDHILGTDKVGRDILSRIMYGSRISVIIALIAIVVSGIIGTALGITAGYWGGWVDALIMRLVDISLSIPIILLGLVLVAALGPRTSTVIGVIVVLLWSRYARLAGVRPWRCGCRISYPGPRSPAPATCASCPNTSSPTCSTAWWCWPLCRLAS